MKSVQESWSENSITSPLEDAFLRSLPQTRVRHIKGHQYCLELLPRVSCVVSHTSPLVKKDASNCLVFFSFVYVIAALVSRPLSKPANKESGVGPADIKMQNIDNADNVAQSIIRPRHESRTLGSS